MTSDERRECEVLADAGCSESDLRLSCRECSSGWHWGKHDGYPRYCPRCGRKIAKVTILRSRTTGELVRCGECIYFGRCPMRKGDGSGYCWQAKRREERNGEGD